MKEKKSSSNKNNNEWDDELDFNSVEEQLDIDDERWIMEFLGDIGEMDDLEDDDEEEEILPNRLLDALKQGVVPADAGVGSMNLPGDYGFDPLDLSTKDYITSIQRTLLQIIPGDVPIETPTKRPQGLILRDYREAEIRHGRLAMLAAVIWPLQEILDRLFIPIPSKDFTMIYGGTTLPFLSLLMTLFVLLLGYLDMHAQSIKQEDAGEAFLPGECFWDPLSILDGSSQQMKWHMQSVELTNGRFAMIAVLSFVVQEAVFHQSLVSLPWNMVLFQPFFTIPEVQYWLDLRFSTPSPIFRDVDSGIDFMQHTTTES